MARKLARNVNHFGVLYEAGSTPPKDIADQFTNDKVWEVEEDSTPTLEEDPAIVDEEPESAPAAKKTAAKKTASSGR